MKIVRTDEQIDRVEKWAIRDLPEDRSRYERPYHDYEQGVIDTLEWLRGADNFAPDGVED